MASTEPAAAAQANAGVEPPAAPSAAPGEVPDGYSVVREGRAAILQQAGQDAFYNPAQVVNRDLSVAVLRQFIRQRRRELADGSLRIKGFKNAAPRCLDAGLLAERQAAPDEDVWVLEGLAASGLRAIRYALEVDGISRVDANDLDPKSVASIQRNVAFNGGAAVERVRTTQGDARVTMLQRAGCYDAVDLDPYGSPAQLLDSAVQAVAEGGLLMVTATDMAVLCGNNGEACWAKYGSYPLHRAFCHEMALRILLASLQSHAARHKRTLQPVLSLSIDFYVRVFVRLRTSPQGTKAAASNLGYVWQSAGCDSFHWQRAGRKEARGSSTKFSAGRGPAVPERCEETGFAFSMGGPFWAEPLHDPAFVGELLAEVQGNQAAYPAHQRLQSMLTTVLEELPDAPLYYSVHDLSKLLRVPPPAQDAFRSALANAGYRVSSTHANPLGVKTDAPPSVVWDVMRAWARQQQPSKKPPEAGSPAALILAKEPQIEVSFARAPAALSASRAGKQLRFPANPQAHWGPKRKHTRKEAEEGEAGGKKPRTAAAAAAGEQQEEAGDAGAGES